MLCSSVGARREEAKKRAPRGELGTCLFRQRKSKGLARLVQRAQTARAQVHAPRFAVDLDTHALDIGLELAVGRLLGVTDVVPELGALAADFALGHFYHLSLCRSGVYHTTGDAFAQPSAQLGLTRAFCHGEKEVKLRDAKQVEEVCQRNNRADA